MTHQTMSHPSPNVFARGSARSSAQWASMAAMRAYCARVNDPSHTGMVVQDHDPALARGAIASILD